MVDKTKLIKGSVSGILLSAGVVAKLADWCLSATEVVLNGMVNVTNSFVKAPNLGIGKALSGAVHKSVSKLSDKLLKKGREMF